MGSSYSTITVKSICRAGSEGEKPGSQTRGKVPALVKLELGEYLCQQITALKNHQH